MLWNQYKAKICKLVGAKLQIINKEKGGYIYCLACKMLFFLGYPLIGVSMEIIWLLRNESNADFLKVL